MNLFQQAVNAVQNAFYGVTAPQVEETRAPLGVTFGSWSEFARLRKGVISKDALRLNAFALDTSPCDLHYESVIDSGNFDTPVNINVERVILPTLDGWLATVAGYHFALGQPGGKVTDGWVGYGGRGGQHWLLTRLTRAGYLHWPTRTWDDVSGAPNYNRNNLALAAPQTLTLPTLGTTYTVSQMATWSNVWTTPGGGTLTIRWRVEGGRLKEDVLINQAARTWITNNHPPTTPLNETFFGFVFQLDIAGIHQFMKNGIWQDMTGDWEDEGVYGVEMRNQLGALIGFLPVGKGGVVSGGEVVAQFGLRRRFWLDPDGNVYLLVGVRCDQLAGLPNGILAFDPTLDTIVGAGADDAHEADDGTGFSAVAAALNCSSNVSAGSRFNGGARVRVTGPANGDTIDVAYAPIHASSTAVDDPNVDIFAEDVDNAANYTDTADVTSRTRTTANVTWTATGIGTGEVNTPSLVAIIQEIIDRPGWVSGNYLNLLFDGRANANSAFRLVSYETSPTDAVKLHLEWTAAVVPGGANKLPLQGVGV